MSAGVLLLYSAALVFLRGRPSLESDAGGFLSVAARLLHGTHLYTGVWDNQAPFFHYAQALALGLVGWRGPFILDVAWLWLAVTSMWGLLGAAGASNRTRVVGVVVFPLLLTGAWYYAGYSELPALALTSTVGWLCFSGRPVRGGVVVGVATFFRPDYGLLLLVIAGVGVYGAARSRSGLQDAGRAALGLAIGLAASSGFLVA